ncbi:MAG: hypothetical protein AAGG80_00990 [Pseudomonadota bacterium]
MRNPIIGIVSIVIAVVVAILAVILSPANLKIVVILSRFFEVMIPFLAVGALIKYLLKDS